MEGTRLLDGFYDEVDGCFVGVMDRGGRRANQVSCSSGQIQSEPSTWGKGRCWFRSKCSTTAISVIDVYSTAQSETQVDSLIHVYPHAVDPNHPS